MAIYDYQIGTTLAGLTNLESLATPVRPPRGRFVEKSLLFDRSDGHVSGHGSILATWLFDVLTVAMVGQLRQFCTGQSVEIWIKTRVPPDSISSTESMRIFNGIMIWPTQDYMDRRQIGGKYLGVEIQFRQLEVRLGAFSSAFSSAFDKVYS